jgi:methyl-accepting chemotaxis protein
MKFSTRLFLCLAIPAVMFVASLGNSIWGLMRTQSQFDSYIRTEESIRSGLSEMYAQGLQMGQALRNMILDPANPKARENLTAALAAYDKAYADTAATAKGTPFEAQIKLLPPLRAAQAQGQDKVIAALTVDAASAIKTLNSAETPAWRALKAELLKQLDAAAKVSDATHANVNANADRAVLMTLVLGVLAVVAAGGLALVVQRSLHRELGGEPAIARDAMAQVAMGNLSGNLPTHPADQSLMAALGRMQESLRELVGQIRESVDSVSTASSEIAAGNQDLANRTEQTASSLHVTAASVDDLIKTVNETFGSATRAKTLAASAASVAVRGGDVVSQVVTTMEGINTSSKKIADIIGVIDGIAFQTNILALNAAVEAARAGEQGRGFAVVASEVRSLAGRSAEAAKEIRGLIADSVVKVEAGTSLVADAGRTMTEIVESVQSVSGIVDEISDATNHESGGISQINDSISQLDQMTQQNSALVEESAAAAESLRDQAARLSDICSRFNLGSGGTFGTMRSISYS